MAVTNVHLQGALLSGLNKTFVLRVSCEFRNNVPHATLQVAHLNV